MNTCCEIQYYVSLFCPFIILYRGFSFLSEYSAVYNMLTKPSIERDNVNVENYSYEEAQTKMSVYIREEEYRAINILSLRFKNHKH